MSDAYLHTAPDGHIHLAYTEGLPDETAATLRRPPHCGHRWFAARSITIERVLTDNACGPHREHSEPLALVPQADADLAKVFLARTRLEAILL
ncbi:hypothetical protein [Streptomyces sp. 142MFCol3.1]|uniref:hypothetical protein n=1 Tax=Streptomyces sp. 142MFCol3.1 TaxID=1172179 RepID=UPI000400BEE7|nr:hypothetical protein [Streptomyces sp. 142MFCol3.1]